MGNKQIINHSQKEQISDISFHTLHTDAALLCVGVFFMNGNIFNTKYWEIYISFLFCCRHNCDGMKQE